MCFYFFTHLLLALLQNSMAKAAMEELATLYRTKYQYGPGASTICKSWRQNCAKNPRASKATNGSQRLSFLSFKACDFCLTVSFFKKYVISFLFRKKGEKYPFQPTETFALRKHLLSVYLLPGPQQMLGEKGKKDGEKARGKGEGRRRAGAIFKEPTAGKREE